MSPTTQTQSASNFRFSIEGMTCASCAGRVAKVLYGIPGAQSAAVNLALEEAHLSAPPSTSWEVITGAVARAGYQVGSPHSDGRQRRQRP